MASKRFEELLVWQKAHKMVLGVYRLSARFPREELFGLTSQLRRAAVSVAANIAEGYKKLGKADKLRFYNTAQGSLEECRYYFILVRDLGLGKSDELMELAEEVGRLLEAYMSAIRGARFMARPSPS